MLPQPQIAFGNIGVFFWWVQWLYIVLVKHAKNVELMQWRVIFKLFLLVFQKPIIETWATAFPPFFQWSKFNTEIRLVLRLNSSYDPFWWLYISFKISFLGQFFSDALHFFYQKGYWVFFHHVGASGEHITIALLQESRLWQHCRLTHPCWCQPF